MATQASRTDTDTGAEDRELSIGERLGLGEEEARRLDEDVAARDDERAEPDGDTPHDPLVTGLGETTT